MLNRVHRSRRGRHRTAQRAVLSAIVLVVAGLLPSAGYADPIPTPAPGAPSVGAPQADPNIPTVSGGASTPAPTEPAAAATTQAPADAAPTPAPPPQPTSAAEARQAWLDASEQAEALNEQVLVAAEEVAAAEKAIADADARVAAANAAAAEAVIAQQSAQATVDSFAGRLRTLASASFRGGTQSDQLTALLTADSAQGYLDNITALNRIAAETNELLAGAKDAQVAADAAAADVTAQQAAARAAQTEAQGSREVATARQTAAVAAKAALDAQAAQYETLFDRLSDEEREAALAAQEARRAAEQAAAAAAEQAAEAAAAEAARNEPQAASRNSSFTATALNPNAQKAVDAALSKVGAKYVFGSAGPNAFDCSGLTSWAWAQAGISIPRTSSAQSKLTRVPLDELQPGDLITYYSPVHHVGMYIGNGKIVHASTRSKPVYVTTVAGGGPSPTGHRVG